MVDSNLARVLNLIMVLNLVLEYCPVCDRRYSCMDILVRTKFSTMIVHACEAWCEV